MGALAKVRRAQDSDVVSGLARWGLGSRALVYFVVGLLALSVLFGGDEETSKDGALRAIAGRPLGEVLLVAVAAGFFGYAAWRALSAAVGHRDDDEPKRTGKRLLSGAKAVAYAGLGLSTLRFLASDQRPKGDRTPSLTAKVLEAPGGQTAVLIFGLIIVATGLGIAVRAALQKHEHRLESKRIPDGYETAASVVGIVGLVGRGLVLALLGGFLVKASVQFDAKEARGLDAALQELAQQPFGRVLLGIAVVGLIGYALWSLVEAACRET